MIITNSRYTHQQITKAYPKLSNKLFQIYKSVDPEHFSSVFKSRQSNNFSGSNTIILVGSNLQRKGIQTLISAAPGLIREIPDIRFRIIGNDPSTPKLIQQCRKLNVETHFYFEGQQSRSQINEAFSEGGVLILPSLTEAFGVVILEAMASGLPVIGTNVGGIPEIIQTGTNGLLIPPNNPEALSKAVIMLLNDLDLRQKFAKAGLETAKKFSLEVMMDKTYNIYQKLMTYQEKGEE